MSLQQRAWKAAVSFASAAGRAHPAKVYDLIREATGKTWTACTTVDWNVIINRFGGGE